MSETCRGVHWVMVLGQSTQHISFQSTPQKPLNTCLSLGLTEGIPFSSVKVRDRGAGVWKAIADAGMLTWADKDCFSH